MSFGFIQERTADNWYFHQAEQSCDGKTRPNPMRGWYSIYTFQAEQKPDFEDLKWCLQENESMALVIFDIGYFKNKALSKDALLYLAQILEFFSEHERDVILRPVYDRVGKGRQHEPETFEQVMMHLQQMGEALQQNAFSVVIFQGLLVGSWGEMHDSSYLSQEHLEKLSQCILPYLEKEIYLAVRTPAQWRQLVDEKTFNNSMCRITLFDDGIFGSDSHLGTFGMYTKEAAGWQNAWMREEELIFEEKLCLKVPCGGEVLASCDGKKRHPEDMYQEIRKMHLSYLNSKHDIKRLDEWREMTWQGQSFYDYVSEHLGYCFSVSSIKFQIKHGLRKKLQLLLEIKNEGFGVCFQETEAELIIESNSEKQVIMVPIDFRKWRLDEKRQVVVNLPFIKGEIYLAVRRKRDKRPIFFKGQKNEAVALGSLTQR